MLKLTKTGIGLLTKQYRSVLRKCLLLNLGLFTTITSFTDVIPNIAKAVEIGSYAYSDATGNYNGWNNVVSNVSRNPGITEYNGNGYQTISSSYSIIQNLEAIDRLLGSYPLPNIGQVYGSYQNNWNYVNLYRASGEAYYHTIAPYISIISNLSLLDYALGTLPSGRYVSNMKSMGDNVKALDDALYNYYYTFRDDKISEAAEFTLFLNNEKLSSVFEA